ncbi:DUF4340 domain-containing protein [Limnoraphis robusta]|uniref:DUF4340 domain-containing protein n=1 Tax=Limnoraphis robusta CCNP1315 TaxID=3110306 RepID=A0ABU5U4I3_9CYAN|nr:DUF4340 domain-containing protein [Limnoraphis robusta]MEA5521980.1 DUF4340 domain-containing protein [Limnoraphis robusta CCNP1315]MEA5545223.1 DUF4340 domain-containing protein [Limnoraphis robusta CCNP1324]
MKFQRSTLILMLIALGLGGYVYLFEVQQTAQKQEIQAIEKQIFSFSRDDVKFLTVKTPEQTVIVERISDSENPQESPWKLTQPVQTPANQATVDFLLNQLVTDQSIPEEPNIGLRRLTISPEELPQYGLDNPQQIVEVKLKNEEIYQLIIGKKDFSGRSIYGKTNTSQTEENLSILVIPEGIMSAIVRPLDEWKLAETQPQETEVKSPPENLQTPPQTPVEATPVPQTNPSEPNNPNQTVPPPSTAAPEPQTPTQTPTQNPSANPESAETENQP